MALHLQTICSSLSAVCCMSHTVRKLTDGPHSSPNQENIQGPRIFRVRDRCVFSIDPPIYARELQPQNTRRGGGRVGCIHARSHVLRLLLCAGTIPTAHPSSHLPGPFSRHLTVSSSESRAAPTMDWSGAYSQKPKGPHLLTRSACPRVNGASTRVLCWVSAI